MADPASKKKKYKIDFLCEGNIESFPWKEKFETMARKLLREEGTENNVNIVLCSDEFVREMNRDYRGLDKVTDVLSFENTLLMARSRITSVVSARPTAICPLSSMSPGKNSQFPSAYMVNALIIGSAVVYLSEAPSRNSGSLSSSLA